MLEPPGDDAPRFEVFYAVTPSTPLDVAAVRRAAAVGGPDRELGLPDGLGQTRFVLGGEG